jgi:hypothetical protein
VDTSRCGRDDDDAGIARGARRIERDDALDSTRACVARDDDDARRA